MSDTWLPRIGVISLALMSLGATIGATIIVIEGREIPPALASIGTTCAATLGVVVIALTRRNDGRDEHS